MQPASAGQVIGRGCCPRCGTGALFQRFLSLRPGCAHCGLDFRPLDQGDGPAALVMLAAGAIAGGLALVIEINFAPPYWVHAVVLLPVILIVSAGLLRLTKAALIFQTYRLHAAEGRNEDLN